MPVEAREQFIEENPEPSMRKTRKAPRRYFLAYRENEHAVEDAKDLETCAFL